MQSNIWFFLLLKIGLLHGEFEHAKQSLEQPTPSKLDWKAAVP